MAAITYVALVAVAVAASTLAFSAADAFVFRRAPYPNADRIVQFERTMPADLYGLLTPEERADLETRRDLFHSVHGHVERGPAIFGVGGIAETAWVEEVTAGLFDALGVLPKYGRPLRPSDGDPNGRLVVLISETLARRMFGRAEAAVGQSIPLGSQSQPIGSERVEVVGVMPAGFRFPNGDVQLWRPLSPDLSASPARDLRTLAVVAPGVSLTLVEHAIAAREGTAARPRFRGPLQVVPMTRASQDPYPHMRLSASAAASGDALFTLLFGAALCLAIIATLNLVSMELASGLARAPVRAVQTALGATRAVLLRTTLLEGLTLIAAGALAGSALAVWSASVLNAALPRVLGVMLLNEIDIDPRAIVFMTAVAFAAWLVASGPLVWLLSRSRLVHALRGAGRAGTVSREHLLGRHAIVSVQVGITVLLLSGGVLFLNSYVERVVVNRSFDSTGLVTISILQPRDPPRTAEALERDLIDRLRSHAGVKALSRVSGTIPPRSRGNAPVHLWLEGVTAPAGRLDIAWADVDGEFLGTLGPRLLTGRSFGAGDAGNQVVVDETFARQFWPHGNALGTRFSFGSAQAPDTRSQEIIGIASHLPAGRGPSGAAVFVIYRRFPAQMASLKYLLQLDAVSGLNELAQIARTVATDSVVRTTIVDDELADLDGDVRIAATVTGTFAGLALFVAVAGIYGVTSFVVAGRTREIGIRLALGATAPDIRRSILRPTMRIVGAGLVAGVVAAWLASRWIESQPIGVTGASLTTHLTVAFVVAAAAALATVRPTRRASRINPAITLRAE